MLKVKACLFDFDGTLVNTMDGFADIAAKVINRYHPQITFTEAREKYLTTSGIPFFQQLELIVPNDSTNSEKATIFEEEKQEGFFKAEFSKEVKATLRKLREKGLLVGVASNNFQTLIDKFIAQHDLVFDIVLGYRENFSKGQDHFNFILEKYNLAKEDLLFVGDSLKDAEKALDFGIKFVGLCGIFSKEQFMKIDSKIITINYIEELLNL